MTTSLRIRALEGKGQESELQLSWAITQNLILHFKQEGPLYMLLQLCSSSETRYRPPLLFLIEGPF